MQIQFDVDRNAHGDFFKHTNKNPYSLQYRYLSIMCFLTYFQQRKIT